MKCWAGSRPSWLSRGQLPSRTAALNAQPAGARSKQKPADRSSPPRSETSHACSALRWREPWPGQRCCSCRHELAAGHSLCEPEAVKHRAAAQHLPTLAACWFCTAHAYSCATARTSATPSHLFRSLQGTAPQPHGNLQTFPVMPESCSRARALRAVAQPQPLRSQGSRPGLL